MYLIDYYRDLLSRWRSRYVGALTLYFCFALMHVTWTVEGADKTMADKILDPLYIISGISMVVFGLLTWSLGRNMKSMDLQICELKKSIKDIEKETAQTSRDLHELCGEHNREMQRGGHK